MAVNRAQGHRPWPISPRLFDHAWRESQCTEHFSIESPPVSLFTACFRDDAWGFIECGKRGCFPPVLGRVCDHDQHSYEGVRISRTVDFVRAMAEEQDETRGEV